MQQRFRHLVASALLLTLTACTPSPTAPEGSATVDPPPPAPQTVGETVAPPKEERPWRYPAYQMVEGVRRWGYVDGSGSFVIAPRFETAKEFGPDGLAVVYRDGKAGIIDVTGALVLPLAANFITVLGDEVRLAYFGDTVKAVDASGKVLFESADLNGSFGSGLAPFVRDDRYGYLDKTGAVAIEPQYAYAGSFVDGKAVVRLPEGRYAVIDTKGNHLLGLPYSQVGLLSEGVLAFQDGETNLWGYTSVNGDLSIPAQFVDARPFSGGFAVVNAGQRYTEPQYGVINRQGVFVIPPRYGDIQDLGDGRFAVAQAQDAPIPAPFAPSAIFTAEGQQLTAFLYYDVVPTPMGLSVSDETETYFLDRQGRRATDLPSAEGIGTMRVVGDLIAVDVDGALRYVTRDGKTVWQAEDSWPLADGASVVERKHRAGRNLLIRYPEVTGLSSAAVQAAINQRLKDLFLRDSELEESIQVEFSVRQVGRVLVVKLTGGIYPLGAAHGMPFRDYYHFDLDTGAEYRLSDLFRQGSAYPERLRALVRRQIEADSRGVNDTNPEVRPDQPFAAGPAELLVYWYPYEIGPYAAGFPSFQIPYAEVHDLINTEGAFWQALGLSGV